MEIDKSDYQLNIENIFSKVVNAFEKIVSFSGKSEYSCVCLVNMVDSTRVTSKMSSDEASSCYSVFLNTMSILAKEL